MHLNARSLLKNLDQLNLMLGSLKKTFSVIGISETWRCDGENKAFIHKFTDENLHKFNENASNTNWSSLLHEDRNIT